MRAFPKIGVAAAAALLTLSVASPAFAHVEAEGEVTGGDLVVTFSFEHGCAGSPTTSLKVQLPAETTVTGTDQPADWTVTTTGEQIDWTGGSVPDGETGTFTATLSLTAPAGETIFFPTVQGCASGEEAWIDKSEDPEAEHAAPRITLTEAVSGTASSSTTTSTSASSSTTATATPGTTAAPTPSTSRAPTATAPGTTAAAATSTSSDSSPLGIILGIVAAIVVVGGAVIIALRLRAAKAADAAAGNGPEAGGTGS